MKYLIPLLLIGSLFGQQIQKDGKDVTTFTYAEALEMLKARDAQWESKLAKADSLIHMYKYGEEMYDDTIIELEEQIKLDSLLLVAKDTQIVSIKAQNEAYIKKAKLAKPSWYENKWLYFTYGVVSITIPTYFGIKIVDVSN